MDSGTITLNDNNSRGSYFSRQSCRTALDFVLNGWEKLFGVLGWLMNRNERAWVRSILHRIEHYVAWRYNIKTKWATNRIFIDLLFEASTSIIYLMFSSATAILQTWYFPMESRRRRILIVTFGVHAECGWWNGLYLFPFLKLSNVIMFYF